MLDSGRRGLLWAGVGMCALGWRGALAQGADPFGGDPLKSHQWPDLRREFLGTDRVVFDERVRVKGPGFADDAMNVPISVDASALPGVERVVVLVDRNPIRKVLEFSPMGALPGLSFRFKLEQASPVRAAARTKAGVWHVGHTVVDAEGGGCTVPGVTRADNTWSRTLGQVQARVFTRDAADAPVLPGASRVRLRVMHPMDTGLVSGIPAFYLKSLTLSDARGRPLLQLLTYEPVSENPVFSFDFPTAPPGPLRLTGTDNNGNRVNAEVGG